MKSLRSSKLTFVAALFAFGCVSLAPAQETRGTIMGRVLDSSGLAVPAIVRAVNVNTGVAVDVVANDVGSYRIPFLNAGTYTITAKAPGFKVALRDEIELRINDQLQVDFTLEVGHAHGNRNGHGRNTAFGDGERIGRASGGFAKSS